MAEATRRARRRLSAPVKLLVLVLAPVAFLALLELTLRVAGYRGRALPALYERFPARKAAGTVRILVLGGSAARGLPFAPRGGPVPLLRELLRDVAPGQPAEVRNCAVDALTSEGVLGVATRLLAYQPDVLIVYAGNNEFFNYPARNRDAAAWEPQPRRWLARTRIYALAEDVALLFRGGEPSAAQRATHAERIEAGQLGRPPDYKLGSLAPTLEKRLREIAALARERGVAVVVGSVASNLRDVPPTAPRHREGLGESQRAAWEAQVARGRARAAAGDPEGALAAFAEAAAADGTHAGLLYEQARCHYALGRYGEAKALFLAARDGDDMPMRATSPRNAALRRVAALPGVAVADAERAFERAAPHGIPGDELFVDHVHLSLAGAMVLARCWAKALEARGLLGTAAGWAWAQARSREQYERALELDAPYVAQAHVRIALQCATAEAGGRKVAAFRRPQFVEAARSRGSAHFAAALRLDPRAVRGPLAELEPYTHCYIALAYKALGEPDRSVNICENVLDRIPTFVLAYEVEGQAHLAAGRSAEAEDALARAAEIGGAAPRGTPPRRKEERP